MMCVLALRGRRSCCERTLDVCEEPTAAFQTRRAPAILHGLRLALYTPPGEYTRVFFCVCQQQHLRVCHYVYRHLCIIGIFIRDVYEVFLVLDVSADGKHKEM